MTSGEHTRLTLQSGAARQSFALPRGVSLLQAVGGKDPDWYIREVRRMRPQCISQRFSHSFTELLLTCAGHLLLSMTRLAVWSLQADP